MSTKKESPEAATGVEDFAAMLEAQGKIENRRLSEGDKVRAVVVHIGQDAVFCEINRTQEGYFPREELLDDKGELTVKIGESLEAMVVSLADGIRLSRRLGRRQGGGFDVSTLLHARENQIPVEGVVTGANKGGLEVTVGGQRAFCPMGQIETGFVQDPKDFIGKTLSFMVREVKEGGRNIVLSRRAVMEADRKVQAQKLLSTLAVGQEVSGVVSRVVDFGIFVDLGGIDGLVPMSELAYSRVENPADLYKVGDNLRVMVLRIEEDTKRPGQMRISLSARAAMPDPWNAHAHELTVGALLSGRVVKLEQFGAFVEVFQGVQGLVHIGQISDKRLRHPSDELRVNQVITVRVLQNDPVARRLSLSLKEAKGENVAAPGKERPEAEPTSYVERGSGKKGLGTFGDLLKKHTSR